MMLLPKQSHRRLEEEADEVLHKKHRHALQRVFDPIPRPVLYTAGIILGLALFSPFWFYLVSEPFERTPIYLTDDAQSLPVPTNNHSKSAAPIFNPDQAVATELVQFAGIRLETRRDELEHRFNLVLQNTRGMQPEIYVAHPADEIQRLTAHFYDGVLKDFTLVMRERLVPLATVQTQLEAQFGPPTDQRDAGPENSTAGLGGLGLGNDSVAKKLAAFAQRRLLVWSDDNYRVDATIYFNHGVSPQPLAVLQIRLAAAAWLKSNRPMVGSSAPVPVPAPPVETERQINPIPALDRKLAP
ncbi:MAG: hypothetical protein PCFJNLEI_00079 [Verrucomicrobiae bacterium]|nr:hypothetical protein [Verrucomicrobiae bacterium]